MKRVIALTVAFAIAGFSLSAQQTREVKPRQKAGQEHRGHTKDFAKDLNLTDAQKAQMKLNREEAKQKMAELQKQDNLTVKEMNQRKAALQQEQKAKMDALLTAEQRSKMAASRDAMKSRNGEMGQKRAAMMKEKLALTDDQAAKLKAHNEATHSKIKAIQENQTLSQEQKKAQMESIKEASKTERKNILTAEQLKKMEEMKKAGQHKKGTKGPKTA
ncbi:MAG: hypothetical protein EOO03_16830 [Chitinophagaceae bacterium]|nr:MAG: hypothetical protein EOO03_16830 [Chitinophagaceae bacterium]